MRLQWSEIRARAAVFAEQHKAATMIQISACSLYDLTLRFVRLAATSEMANV